MIPTTKKITIQLLIIGIIGIPIAAYLDILWQGIGSLRAFLVICTFEYLVFCLGFLSGYGLGIIRNKLGWKE